MESGLSLWGVLKPEMILRTGFLHAGQFVSDPRRALFFPEKRPFFIEGLEAFSVPHTLIYTRDIEQPDAVVSKVFTAADTPALEASLAASIARIRAGEFRPTPSAFACSGCPALDVVCAGPRLGGYDEGSAAELEYAETE